jgi:hypothetical protein
LGLRMAPVAFQGGKPAAGEKKMPGPEGARHRFPRAPPADAGGAFPALAALGFRVCPGQAFYRGSTWGMPREGGRRACPP